MKNIYILNCRKAGIPRLHLLFGKNEIAIRRAFSISEYKQISLNSSAETKGKLIFLESLVYTIKVSEITVGNFARINSKF